MRRFIFIALFFPSVLLSQSLPQVGDFRFGGIVFYVDSVTNSGLVASVEDLGEYSWGCNGVSIIGADSESIGSGFQNTLDIINQNCLVDSNNLSAAFVCDSYEYDGFTDWYLPSFDELQLMYNEISFGSDVGNVGGFASLSYYYWSSSEQSSFVDAYSEGAVGVQFLTGEVYTHGRMNEHSVRAVRTFTSEELGVGCTDINASNYNSLAILDDSSCLYTSDEYEIVVMNSVNAISSYQQALDSWNTSISLEEGWNFFGYGCPSPVNTVEVLSSYVDKILIVKDNNGSVYMPEFGFNGVGELLPGMGYQVKLSSSIDSFSLCDWYVNDIPEGNIITLQEQVLILNDSIISLNSQEIIQVGDTMYGGIVFYVDETGQHGLVSSMSNIEVNSSNILVDWDPTGSCGMIEGADGEGVGDGFQNTLDIVGQQCMAGWNAAEICYNYEENGFDDWFLPSKQELLLMYHNIGSYSFIGNVGGFHDVLSDGAIYWSSTEYDAEQAWFVNFGVGADESNFLDYQYKAYGSRVRPIRSF